jgi:hypothetical protein
VIYFLRLYKAKSFVPDLLTKIPTNLLDPLLLEGAYIPPIWWHHRSLSTRIMPSSFTTVLHHHVSQKFFANGMKSAGMHLSSDRSLHGFSSLSCYHTSLRPWCAGSKCRTCSSSNTSSSTLLSKFKRFIELTLLHRS